MLASPPTSRPPMALGWPVIENGPIPGRPIRPEARWQLMMALALSAPEDDWLSPWLHSVTTFSVRTQSALNASSSRRLSPVTSATRCAGQRRASASAAGRPATWAATYSASMAPSRSIRPSSPLNRAASEPGATARCRSARSEVAVRRGSIVTTFMEGRAALAAAMR